MIFLSRLDDHAEPTPLGGPRAGRNVPSIAEACGFAPRDYVPDPMAAPLGRFHYLIPEAPRVRPPVAELPIRLPSAWTSDAGSLALAMFFVCDVLAPCDRLPGVTEPEDDAAPPLQRSDVTKRLGNLRDGRPRLDALFGGACLQGTHALDAQRNLHGIGAPSGLVPDVAADLRCTADPALDEVRRALVALYNALSRDPAIVQPRRALIALWHKVLKDDVVPALCGPMVATPYRPKVEGPRRSLPLEVVLGPFALLVPMLLARQSRPAAEATFTRLCHRARRHDIPPPQSLLTALGLRPTVPVLAGGLPSYLVAEALAESRPFGPLGAALFANTALSLIAAENMGTPPALDPPSAKAFAHLRNITIPKQPAVVQSNC